ncbi:Phosphatidylserine decarboxylase proenzyme [bacterium HR40]|nr:Phosphatidylserine decarboxylase proenzyme [bacterium HR40]
MRSGSDASNAGSGLGVPVHREGWRFILLFFGLSLLFGLLWRPLFGPGIVLTLWCAYFFRDPPRVTPLLPGAVVSPADGRVVSVTARVPPAELGLGAQPLPCISVFMSVFDVHVNRTPVPGRVVRRSYRPGRFFNAALDKASDDNERQGYVIEDDAGRRIGLVQIAGLIARRIVGFAEEGTVLHPGDRIGLIRFGSRCDVYLPQGIVPRVCVGQRTVAGETVIAYLDGPQVAVEGRRT